MAPDTGRAFIDGGLEIHGADARYIGLEIMSSELERRTTIAGSTPADLPRAFLGISVNAPRVSLAGLHIHDLGNALFAGILAEDLTIEGCIIYNNGWQGPDRGHGHGLYLQNRSPSRKRIVGNVVFNQFSTGIKVSGTSAAWLENVDVEDNITFDNGAPVAHVHGFSANVFHQGGRGRSGNLNFRRNFMISSDDSQTSFLLNISTPVPGNGFEFIDNVVQGRSSFGAWNGIVMRGNTFAMPFVAPARGIHMVESMSPVAAAPHILEWNRNQYVVRSRTAWPLSTFINGVWADLTYEQWRSATSLDAQSDYFLPSEARDVQRTVRLPSMPGRGFVAFWSARGTASFTADISGIVRPGQRFEIRHVYQLDGAPVASGVFNGQRPSLSAVSPAAPNPIGMQLNGSLPRRPPAVYLVTAH